MGLVGTRGGVRGVKTVMGTIEIDSGVLDLPPRHLTTQPIKSQGYVRVTIATHKNVRLNISTEIYKQY